MEAGKFSKKYNQLNDKQKEKYSRKEWKQAKERAQQRQTNQDGGGSHMNSDPTRRSPTQSAQDLIKGMRERNNSTGKPSMTVREAAERQNARNNPQPAASPNEQALNNEHTPKANDVGTQAKPVPTYQTRDQLPSYMAGDISHHATEKSRAPGLGDVHRMERWLNDDYRKMRSEQDGKNYGYNGLEQRDWTDYRAALLKAHGQEAVDKHIALHDPEKRRNEAAAKAADARQRYEFLAAGGAGGEAGRAQRMAQKFGGGSPMSEQLKLMNSNNHVDSSQIYSPKTGQIETVHTPRNKEMDHEISRRAHDAWRDYIDFGHVTDFSDTINKYGMTEGDNYNAGPAEGSGGGKQMGYVVGGKTYYEPEGLTPNQKFNKMMEVRRANPGKDINPDNWFAYQ